MELVIKLYDDKPSRIGIKFIYEFLAVKPYERIISRHGHENFSVTMEPKRGLMQLTLRSEHDGGKIEYKDLEFKYDQVKKLIAWYEPGTPLHFVHVFPKENRLMVAKPFRTERLIEVSALAFVGFGD